MARDWKKVRVGWLARARSVTRQEFSSVREGSRVFRWDWPRFIIFYYTWGNSSFLPRSRGGRWSFQLSSPTTFFLSLSFFLPFFFFLFFSTTRRPRYRVSSIDGNILYPPPQRLNAARNGDDRTPGRDSLENIYRFDGTI